MNSKLKCTVCRAPKAAEAFYPNAARKTGYSAVCRDCNGAYKLKSRYRSLLRREGRTKFAARIDAQQTIVNLMREVYNAE